MSKHTETETIYQQIKKEMELPEEALTALGITRDDIDEHMDAALKFMNKEQAMKSILAIWKTSAV